MLSWWLLLGLAVPAQGQVVDPPVPSLTAQMQEALQRVANGHSLTPEQVAGAGSAAVVDQEDLQTAIPLLARALGSQDGDLRTYTLTVLQSLEAPPVAPSSAAAAGDLPPAGTVSSADSRPASGVPPMSASLVFRPEVGKDLAVLVPRVILNLQDERETDRILAVGVLGGFGPEPPSGVVPALTAYLRRPDAVGPVGQAVAETLLGFGTVSTDTALALSRYLKRADQTPESRAGLVDAIAAQGGKSTLLNGALLSYLDADDPGLRARLILSLPQLQLLPELFAEVRARVSLIAQNESENLQVAAAARAVSTCWTAMRMTAGCPAY